MDSRIQAQETSQSSRQEQDLSSKQQPVNTKAGRTSYQKPNNVGKLWKKILIFISDGSHVDFCLKLKYDRLKHKTFFKNIIEAYLSDDPEIRILIEKFQKKENKSVKNKIVRKHENEKKQTIKDFGLDESDIENIFDILEKESNL